MTTGPAVGGSVMAGGIVSTALLRTGHHDLSVVVLVVACALWLALAALLAHRTARDLDAVRRGAHQPAALTAVAGTAVLGARFTAAGVPGLGWAALGLAAAGWVVLLPPVLRALPRRHAPGAAFLLTVATAGLAVLVGELAKAYAVAWPAVPAAVLVVLGLALYLDVLRRFAVRPALLDGAGDHWVAGGALAISALALGTLAGVVDGTGHDLLRRATLLVWVLAVCWLPALVAGELARPRPEYHAQRWATVFPLGMYVAATAALARAWPSATLRDVAHVAVWVALLAWALALAGLARRVA